MPSYSYGRNKNIEMKEIDMLAIGLTGPIGAGKDAVSEYLKEEHNFEAFSCGDAIREIAREEGLEPNRENLGMIGKERRQEEGKGFLGKKAAEMAKKDSSETLVINGIRNPEEVEELRKKLENSFVLVYVHADEEIRFERLKERGRPGDPETFPKFKEQDKKEKERFNMEETFSMADRKLSNEGTLEDLYRRTDKLLSEIKQGRT